MKNHKDRDGSLLVITGIVASIVIFGGIYFLETSMLAAKYQFFIYGSCIYAAGTYYLAFTSSKLKPLIRKMRPLLILTMLVGLTVLLFYVLFSLRIIAFPKFLLPYLIGSIILAPITITIFEYLLSHIVGNNATPNK